MTTPLITVDASAYDRLAREIGKLPVDIKRVAARRALGRANSMLKTAIVRRSSERIKAPVRKVAERVRVARLTDNLEARVRSNWLTLIDLKPRQTKTGVSVPVRGSYRSAFIATMKSQGVFKRQGKARGPVNELYGPNPANDIVNNGDVYLDLLVDIIETRLVDRFLHEATRLLPG